MPLPVLSSPRSCPSVGVVLPTWNRRDALAETLRHLARQTLRDFLVVVVDDDSTDGTQDTLTQFAAAGHAGFQLHTLHQRKAGAGEARNLGIALLHELQGEDRNAVTVLLGDDTFPAPDFLERHLALHRAHPEPEAVAIGLTRWATVGQTVTPLMQWLEREGVQFNFGELLAGTPASWRHFYTSNLSAKTAYLHAHPFDRRLAGYGLEDIELGYRLARRHGLSMHFLPEAVVEHLHPTDFAQSCRRALAVGRAEHRLGEIWPELRPADGGWKQRVLRLLSGPVLLPAVRAAAEASLHVRFPNPLVPRALQLHRLRGYTEAAREATPTPATASLAERGAPWT